MHCALCTVYCALGTVPAAMKKARLAETRRAFDRAAGDGLLSHGGSPEVPSTLTGLTTVFGMGTGVALSR